ncbi:uncharacterized protein LODBEIA_P36470 [Lodderomyces beijingensis]|uniref:SAP domain-containing protein n=1 Tax=Lodderomyces beijingensis TaxID=1775926 RepID=A0ABP0ZP06_9ASCO
MSDYSSQTVAQLKDILKERGLSTDGKKADLVTRLIDSDNVTTTNDDDNAPAATAEATIETAQSTTTPAEKPAAAEQQPSAVSQEESTLTVIQPQPKKTKHAEDAPAPAPPPKVLTADERKQLAIELLQKKVARAEKFGDEKAAAEARKDLSRVEKFGVELGTALAREIGLVDDKLKSHGFKKRFNNGKHRGFKKSGRGGRK